MQASPCAFDHGKVFRTLQSLALDYRLKNIYASLVCTLILWAGLVFVVAEMGGAVYSSCGIAKVFRILQSLSLNYRRTSMMLDLYYDTLVYLIL